MEKETKEVVALALDSQKLMDHSQCFSESLKSGFFYKIWQNQPEKAEQMKIMREICTKIHDSRVNFDNDEKTQVFTWYLASV